MGGGLETVDAGLGEEWLGRVAEPLDRLSVRGRDGRCGAVALDDELLHSVARAAISGMDARSSGPLARIDVTLPTTNETDTIAVTVDHDR